MLDLGGGGLIGRITALCVFIESYGKELARQVKNKLL